MLKFQSMESGANGEAVALEKRSTGNGDGSIPSLSANQSTQEVINVNLDKIERLVSVAVNLSSVDMAATNRVVGLIDRELDNDPSQTLAKEIQALQASNDIKQANLNLLAREVLAFDQPHMNSTAQTGRLFELAKSLIQEEQLLGEASSNGVAPGQLSEVGIIDPVAQVVENLKNARAEVLRLVKLRKQTSNQDGEVADAHAEACRAVFDFKEELIKAIDAQLK